MVQCWLVERSYGDRDLVTLVYATPEGDRAVTKEIPMTAIASGTVSVTAAKEVDDENLEPVDGDDRERYRSEVERVRESHAPDEGI
jgi:hypothetical protein